MNPLYIVGGIGAYLLLSGKARALGLGGLGGGAGESPDAYVGRMMSEIPADVTRQILAGNLALAGPPPRDGALGFMYLPDRLANGSTWTPPDILVRRTATERARDLGWAFLPDFTWASPSARLRKVPVNGQRDQSLGAQVGRIVGGATDIAGKIL